MKKEGIKENKDIILIAGTLASIVMMIIVSFYIKETTFKESISGNAIELNQTSQEQLQKIYTKEEVDIMFEKRFQEINSEYIFNMDNLSGTGNAYACVNSEGRIFRSENPCK